MQSYHSNKKVQISSIVKKLNKPSAVIISLLKKVGVNVSDEQDYVDKIFAESLWLVFNPKTKNTPSFESEGEEGLKLNNKDIKTEEIKSEKVSKNSIKDYKENTSKNTEKPYKICPYCSANLKTSRYEQHIIQECPKGNVKLPLTTPKKIQEMSPVSKEDLPKFYNEKNLPEHSFNKLEIEKIYWKLLPQGEWLFTELQNHFRRLSSTKKWRNKPFDEARLFKIEKNLKPNKCFVGKDEFDGYVVYCFDWTQNVILECPIYGNAIYIIKKGKSPWQEIAKATKWEARTKYREQVTVINHSETWLERLKENLRYRP